MIHGFSEGTWMSESNREKIVEVFVKACLGGEKAFNSAENSFYWVLLYSDMDIR